MRGVPVRTYDVSLSEWAAGRLDAEAAAAAATAAATLRLRASQLALLSEAEALVPSLPDGSSFRSVSGMLRYVHAMGLTDDPGRCKALAALWQEAVHELAPRTCAGAHVHGMDRGGGRDGAIAAAADTVDMVSVFERLLELTRKPADVRLRFVRVRFGLSLGHALGAACDAASAYLTRSGAEHSSARTLLDTLRSDATAALGSLIRHLHHAYATLSSAH